ncbi:MAG: zinc ribbon domain-containing protein [Chloroflexi bacterium]|jgi:hypothetical protein|nr:zinc ribbon domain-containing protein [Chloroflexota bacterium]
MDLGSLFLILALLILVGLVISRPFYERKLFARPAAITPDDHEYSALMAERDRLLGALQELDFDYALGKIPEEDYPAQRAQLLQRGAEILRSLDRLQPDKVSEDAEARLEAAVAARRADAGTAVPGKHSEHARPRALAADASPDDDIEVLLANRRRARQAKAAGFCPQCGGPVQKSDRFCPRCGSKVG